jgi:hypothetical protein
LIEESILKSFKLKERKKNMSPNVDQESGGGYKQVVWDGNIRNWIVWETKMQARAVTKKWYEVMMGLPEDVPADSIVLDEDNVEHANDIKKRDANRCGYSDLISLIDTTKSSGRAAFSVVRMAKSETSSMGSLPLAWARLKNKYSPKSPPRLGRLQGMFYSSKLKPGNDPVNFADSMEAVRTEMDEIHQDTDGVAIGATLMSRLFSML